MKVDLELVKMVVQRNLDGDVRRTAQILEDLNQELAALADEEREPPVKKDHVIILSDPKDFLRGHELTGWVVQIPEGENALTAADRIIAAAQEFNASPKGRRLPIKTIGEACEHVPSRYLKEARVFVKTKEPVAVVTTTGRLPGALERGGAV